MSEDVPQDHVCVAMAADSYRDEAYLIAQPTRSKVRRVIGSVSLNALPAGYEPAREELEDILWEIATAAAGILEKHLPRLRAIVEEDKKTKAATDSKRRGTEH